MVELELVLLFMIGAALIAASLKDLVSSVVAVGAVGIGLCMAFLILKAPDLAMMQLVVEILSLIILIRGTIKRDLPFCISGRWIFNTTMTVIFIAVFMWFAGSALKEIPLFGDAALRVSKGYLERAAASHGRENVIELIASDYRVYDVIGEVAVVVIAVVGILAITRTEPYKKGYTRND